ncbi:EAL domain-containing protein [Pseudomonas sp. ES3-33]|uniref:EAL domain-containing protein n=1 Tax=Pseudomonas sp. ES3-33 TaxID=1628833 RepID=UPI0006965F49|nr:EAL domain-containing protein [Pseudomonas sp. ES3-33]
MSAQTISEDGNEHLRLLFQHTPGFMCVLRGRQHIFELANDAYYQLIGHRQILGSALADALPEVIEQGYLDKLDHVFATGEPFIGRALPIKLQCVLDGPLTQCYIDLIYQPIRASSGQISGIFVQGHDVTEAHNLAQDISYQAAHDSLTGLYNRREFDKKSHELDRFSGTHALLYMDLDHFKIINDRGGHDAGDALLRKVAAILKQHVRHTDLLARLGGDEFALILRDCSETDAIELAHTLRSKIRDIPFFWNERRYSVTLSVGLVGFGTLQFLPFSEALSLADIACFLAKEKGRDRVQVSHADDLEITERQRDMDWVNHIKDCIRDDRVVLYGQRFTAMLVQDHGSVECREVLARLLDTEGNLIYPGSFIPPAERFGIIDELDRHIIRKAFSNLQSLPVHQRAKTRYFINVSGVTLSTPGFSAYIARMLADYVDVQPCQVCFEVTETAAIWSLPHTAAVIQQLVDQGFSFALDDFGSGMSSFSYLQQLPVQYVKIDGEFIKGILTHSAGASIVEAVVKVARAMNILTVAESVEFPEFLPLLLEIGVDYGQGYALHRPEPL